MVVGEKQNRKAGIASGLLHFIVSTVLLLLNYNTFVVYFICRNHFQQIDAIVKAI